MTNRTKELAHYIIFRREPAEVGRTKLAKILWAADIMMYRRHGRSVSGADGFVKLQHGPVPIGFFEVIDSLLAEGKIVARDTPTPVAYRKEYLWLVEPDVSNFSGEEIAIIEEAADYICKNHTATSISNASHDALWDETAAGGHIDLRAAATIPGEITPEILAWAEADA